MRKVAAWVFAFALFFSLALPSGTIFASTNTMKLVVDGVEVTGYEQPFVSNDQVLIPVENVFNEAGFKVSKGEKGKVSVTNTHLTIDFDAAASKIVVNGKKADTEFPLTLQNAGNYVSSEFLSQQDGFKVTVSEDKKTVNVATNRVKDVDVFLEKMLSAELNSYSTKMILDQKMESSTEELGSMNMLMEMDMDIIQNPMAMYLLTKMTIDVAGESIDQTSKAYFSKDGFFQNDGTDDTWVKFDDELTEVLLAASIAQADPLAQLELTKKFMKGIHIFEYENIYVMTQTMTNEEFKAMMEESMSLLNGLIPEGLLGEDSVVVEATVVSENKEVTVETENKEAIEEETAEDLEGIFDDLEIDIEEFYVASTIDKKTLFPISTTGVTRMTMGIEDEKISIKQIITGTYSNFNAVKEIKTPAEVIKNAISMEEYFEKLGIDFEGEEVEAQ